VDEKNTGFELRLSLRSLGAIVASAVVLLGGQTIYRSVEAAQSWVWILFQAAIMVFGLAAIMVCVGVNSNADK
jgi:hypothetical protein